MYLCLECGHVFDEAKCYIETHNMDTPPYEMRRGCPNCSGSYVKATLCSQCGELVTGYYAVLKDRSVLCDNCYEIKNVEW